MRIEDLPDHTLILDEDTAINISVLRDENDPAVFYAFETNWGRERTKMVIELNEGPGGHIDRAKTETKEGWLLCWCANKNSAVELFSDLYHYEGTGRHEDDEPL